MIVFAAVVPHPPLLLPTVGKDKTAKLAATAAALETLEQALYLARPDTLVIVSPHGPVLPDAFSIDLSADYALSFKEFGDFRTTAKYRSDFMLIDRIQRNARKETPLTLISEPTVDYGIGIPALFLTKHLPQATLVPVLTSGLDLKTHYDFGKLLKEELMASNKRVAVIASADLSHALTQDAPAGFAKEGAELDKAVQDILTTRNAAGMIGLDPALCDAAHECGVRPITVLLGALDGMQYGTKVLSYEAPFGVGYLVADLALS